MVLKFAYCVGVAPTYIETYSTANRIFSFEKEDDKMMLVDFRIAHFIGCSLFMILDLAI